MITGGGDETEDSSGFKREGILGIVLGAELAGAGFQIGNAADDAANDDATS